MSVDIEEQAMDVTSTSGLAFPPKWSICVRCKSLPKTRNVISLPCLHICCSKECVDRFFDHDGPSSCPECYQRFNREALHSCSYLNTNILMSTNTSSEAQKSASASSEPQNCRSCVRDAPAHRWCIDCVEFLCEYCTEHHQFGKFTRTHTLAPISEGIVELDEETMELDRKCVLHKKEDLFAFCETCEAALCIKCKERHVGHSIKSLDTLASEFQKEFYAGLDVLKTIQNKSQLAIKALDSKLKLILTEQKNYMHREARAFFKRLIDALLRKEIQLRKDLVESTLSKAKELNIKKAKVSSLMIQCQQYMDTVQEIVEKGSRWNILHQRQHLRKQYKELAASHGTLTNPDTFDIFVEKDYSFVIEEKPIEMPENWIDKICQPIYKNLKKREPTNQTRSPDEEIVRPFSSESTTTEENIANRLLLRGKRPTEADRTSSVKSPRLTSPDNEVASESGTASKQQPSGDSDSSIIAKRSHKKRPESRPDSEAETQVLDMSNEEEQEGEDKDRTPTRRSIRVPKRFENEETSPKKSPRIVPKSASPDDEKKTPNNTTGSRRSDSSSTGKRPETGSSKLDKTKGTSPVSVRTPRKSETTVVVDTPRRHSGSSSSIATRSRDTSLRREKRSDSLTTASRKSDKKKKKKEAGDQKKTEEQPRRGRGRPRKNRDIEKEEANVRASEGDQSDDDDDESAGELKEYPILREERMKITMEDENEDYCAVCLDGGDDVLICCDKCPKVFHLKCHIPVIKAIPEADWQCLFCTSYDEILERYPAPDHEPDNGQVEKVPEREFYVACKFLCELYKVKESLAVRGFYDKMFKQYMNQSPVSLTTMRLRLAMGIPKPFKSTLDIVQTSRKLLYQAKMFYSAVSKENKFHLDKFEEKYEEILAAYFPLLTDLKYDPELDKDALPLKFTEHKPSGKQDASTSSSSTAKP